MAGRAPHAPLLLTLLAAAALLQLAVAQMSWTVCDSETTAYVPDLVTLTPDPPVIGSPATFTISGTTDNDVAGGTVEINVSFMGMPIYTQQEDLCSKTSCPVPSGPISITLVEYLPPIAPPGDYGLRVVARDASGGELVCIDVDFQLVAPSLDATTAQPASNTKLLPGRQQQQEQGQAGAGTGGAATKEGGLPAQQGAANRRAAAF